MNTGQRTIAGMLAVVAVMLGLNLIVRGSPTAVAREVITAGPVQPVPISLSVSKKNSTGDDYRLFRLWSDGAVDMAYVDPQGAAGRKCDPPIQCGPISIIPGTCMADVDRDGIVGVPDLLATLAAWGPCP